MHLLRPGTNNKIYRRKHDSSTQENRRLMQMQKENEVINKLDRSLKL